MLSVLRIQNLAIIKDIEIEFREGLNVLTGETGAGKSIVLKAIGLLTGNRAATDLIRSGSEKCVVEAIFHPAPAALADLESIDDELAAIADEEELLIRRVVEASGRSKIYINGRLSTATILQNVASKLLDITGQHQSQSLFDPLYQLRMLDLFGVPGELRDQTAEAYATFAEADRKLRNLQQNQAQQSEYFRRLAADSEELNAAGLTIGERTSLEEELTRLQSNEALTDNVNRCLEMLDYSDDSLDSRLRILSTILDQSSSLDKRLVEVSALVESASVQLSEAKLQLAEYGTQLEADPNRLDFLRSRIAEIARLERKYNQKEDLLVRYLAQIDAELAEFQSGGFDETNLAAKVADERARLVKLETRLTAERVKVAAKLSKLIEGELAHLGMKRAKFEIAVATAPSSPRGADTVEFLLAANPGEPARPIARVASGGELSRILLVLKTLLNEKTGPGTQIYDEVDVGIGGAVAQIVGEKLHAVSRNSQVILITHAPQIAALADVHLVLEKSASDVSTTTTLRVLNDADRVGQIAAMLAGKNVSGHFEQSAKELLQAKSAIVTAPRSTGAPSKQPGRRTSSVPKATPA